jgi:hypothetical protein
MTHTDGQGGTVEVYAAYCDWDVFVPDGSALSDPRAPINDWRLKDGDRLLVAWPDGTESRETVKVEWSEGTVGNNESTSRSRAYVEYLHCGQTARAYLRGLRATRLPSLTEETPITKLRIAWEGRRRKLDGNVAETSIQRPLTTLEERMHATKAELIREFIDDLRQADLK